MAKIVVADDEKDVLELMQFILERDGHQVLTANNGEAAVELIKEEIPDLVLLDVMMPGMDGYTVNTKILEYEKTKDIPVIILTAKAKVKELFQMAPNIEEYIEKPFAAEFLKDRIREILQKHDKS
ncbi:MAG: response regulator [bacterium]